MISTFEVENFRCLKHVSLQLTPLHALIGPNDSGKTTILRAIGEATTLASSLTPSQEWVKFVFRTTTPTVCSVRIAEGSITLTSADGTDTVMIKRLPGGSTSTTPGGERQWVRSVTSEMSPAILIRLDADALRRVSGLLPKHQLKEFLTSRGTGLPGVYQYIQGQGGDTYRAIESRARDLFPTINAIRVVPSSPSELMLEVELRDGIRVLAPSMSDGLLYYLAFAAIRHVFPSGTFLIEEPENGLHPARIRDVIRILRDFVEQNQAQVIVATHSPLVVNEFRPDEVTVVTRTVQEGTKAVLIKDTPHFERRSKTAELGELWLSYADGISETPLLDPTSS